jgi:hypothetical protein
MLFGSLAIVVVTPHDFRPMTLRPTLSRGLRFGRLVDLDQQPALILDAELCAITLSRDFAFFGSLAVMAQFSFRPKTLRRRVFPVLLFIGALILSRFPDSISSQQMF